MGKEAKFVVRLTDSRAGEPAWSGGREADGEAEIAASGDSVEGGCGGAELDGLADCRGV